MNQLEIEFFYPLTEQIDLDLDFTPCIEDQKARQAKMFADSVIMPGGISGQFSYLAVGSAVATGFVIDKDSTPITIRSEKKPSFIQRTIYKALGVNWVAK